MSNGSAGCEERYFEAIYAACVACASANFPTNTTPPITQHRQQRWPANDDPAAAAMMSCACGFPGSGVEFDVLESEVPCAAELYLVQRGNKRIRKGTQGA